MQKSSIKFVLSLAFITSAVLTFAGCDPTKATTSNTDTAATVNGKAIKNEQVEKIVKQNLQGQEGKASPLELAQIRLQALEGLIQTEVMYQRAETEKTLPTDDEVTQALNEFKQRSNLTIDEYNKRMAEAGETEAGLRETIKKQLAIKKLGDKIAATVEPPKDSEVEAFFKGNPELFLSKRGASFAIIMLDPKAPNADGSPRSPEQFQLKAKELGAKLNQPGIDFVSLVTQYSEDPQTASRGGDWRAFSEDEMKQLFGDSFADYVMNKAPVGQIIPQGIPFEGKTLIMKVTNKKEKDENLTLESPNVKQQVIDLLTGSKKQLLSASYQANVMNEARIENFLAKRVVQFPNELSGARPAPDPNAPAPSPTAAASPATSPTGSPQAAPSAAKPIASPKR